MIETIFSKLDRVNFSSLNWRAFGIAFAGILFMEIVHMLGVRTSFITNALPAKVSAPSIDIMNIVRPKLKWKKNEYNLIKKRTLIPHSYASSSYENASSYIVVNFDTGEIIEEKDASKKLAIASLTKLMTAVVALDLSDVNEKFLVSENASEKIPTKIGVIPGQKMILKELLNASLLTSANDATEVIKEGIDAKYGKPVFIKSMNIKARFLGLKNTHFENPQGFDGLNHYSTAEDLVILSHYAISNYPIISQIVKKDYEFLPANGDHKQFDLYNWNGLVNVYPQVLGVKIGNTNRAGYTTIVLSQRDDKKILVVLLGAPGILERDMWAAQLLDLGFEESFSLDPAKISQYDLYKKYSGWNT